MGKDELPEIYTKKRSQIELACDCDSDPEYIDYLKVIQEINRREKNGKKPK